MINHLMLQLPKRTPGGPLSLGQHCWVRGGQGKQKSETGSSLHMKTFFLDGKDSEIHLAESCQLSPTAQPQGESTRPKATGQCHLGDSKCYRAQEDYN